MKDLEKSALTVFLIFVCNYCEVSQALRRFLRRDLIIRRERLESILL